MSDLHQQVWEFVYDLLPEDEAQAMRERITSDPEVARAYAEVKLQTDILARASRFESEQMVWAQPKDATSSEQSPTPASQPTASTAWRRTANWLVGVAAAGLLYVMCSPLLVSDSRENMQVAETIAPTDAKSFAASDMETEYVRTVVTGPSMLDEESVNTFAIRTTNAAGEPLETDVAARFYDETNRVAFEETTRTDSSGTSLLELPSTYAKTATRLELAPANAKDFLSRPLEVSAARQMTYLRLDRPLYQPGDSVKYRSVTLSRLGLQADAKTQVRYFVTGPDDNALEPSERVSSTTEGVGSGEFAVPDDARDGLYAVVAQSPNQRFAEEWREFEVRRYRTPRFKQKLKWAKDSYAAGELVEADFSAEYATGGAIANAELKAEAFFDDDKLAISETKTDADGVAKLTFRVPETLEYARGRLSVTVGDSDGDETISEDVPINIGKVNVEFYPEGGKLVAGLSNRLYFQSRDPAGKPVHIEGRIADESDTSVAEVATIHEGRGVVSFTPQADVRYQLAIQQAAGGAQRFELPPVDAEQRLVMQTDSGVFQASDPIELKISTRNPETPLVVAGYCRGAMVGELSIEEYDYEVAHDGVASVVRELALVPDAQGVIRVTVFDGSENPVVPIAERLVYREVSKALHVNLSGVQPSYTPGSSVELQVAVTDEDDAPQDAVLGVSVVDDAILNLGKDKSTRLPTYFHLLTDIANPQDLEDANFYVSSEEGAEQAMDLLLGTQGWRRFVEVPSEDYLAARVDDLVHEFAYRQSSADSPKGLAQPAFMEGFDLPFLAEQQSEPRPAVSQPLKPPASQPVKIAKPHRDEPASGSALILVAGGTCLLLLLTVLGNMRTGLSFKVWAPSGAIAAVALVLGLLSTQFPSEPTASTGAIRTYPTAAEAQTEATAEALERADLFADEAGLMGGAVVGKKIADEADVMQGQDAPGQMSLGQSDSEPAAESATEEAKPAATKSNRRAMELSAQPAPAAEAELPSRAVAVPRERLSGLERFSKDKQLESLGERAQSLLLQERRTLDRLWSVQDARMGREYAPYFETLSRFGTASTKSQATIYWQPYLKPDASGKVPVTFNLPQRETTYRIIVEAHGSGRLGAAETLIISKSKD